MSSVPWTTPLPLSSAFDGSSALAAPGKLAIAPPDPQDHSQRLLDLPKGAWLGRADLPKQTPSRNRPDGPADGNAGAFDALL